MAATDSTLNYTISIKSDPEIFKFTSENLKQFKRILFTDSIYTFFPTCELSFFDAIGKVVDDYQFVLGHEFDVNFGNDEDGYIGHKYTWAENVLSHTSGADYLNGLNSFIFASVYYKRNIKKSLAYQETCSIAASTLLKDAFALIDSNKIFIEDTQGVDWRYLCNIKPSLFFEHLCIEAYSKTNTTSPFVTFINSNGEFFFCSFDYLFNNTDLLINPDDPYVINFNEGQHTNPNSIISYGITFTGYSGTFDNIQQKISKLDDTGSFQEVTEKLQDHLYRTSKDKFTFRKQEQEQSNYKWLGLYEEKTDIENFKGKNNYSFITASTPYRLHLTINFNPKAVSGHTIDVILPSYNEKDKGNVLTELSGKWLIVNSSHSSTSDNIVLTELEVVKQTLPISNKHIYYNDFV